MKKNVKYIIAGTVVVVMIAALIVAWIFITQTKVSNAVANIYQNGTLIRSIDLETVEESYTFKIEGENGAYNTVLVEPGHISITDSSCPDKVCISQGRISDGVLPITCLPNGIVIQIETQNTTNSTLDGMTR